MRADADVPATLTPQSPVKVRFEGARGREGPLTLGQLNILQWIMSAPEPFDSTVGGSFEVLEGTRVSDVVDSLAVLIVRHEGLRTLFSLDGHPRQRVLASGELTLVVYSVESVQPAPTWRAVVAAELSRSWLPHVAPCPPTGLPLWVAIAVQSDLVYACRYRLSHLVADFQTTQILEREFADMICRPPARIIGRSRHQPLDQAEREHSPELQRRASEALHYWEVTLPQTPQCLYPAPGTSTPSESVAVEMQSTAAAMALRLVAARTRLSRPSIVLAAVCALLSRRTGTPGLAFPTIASNRFAQHLSDHVGTLVQASLAAVEVGTATFDELVRRAWVSVVLASQHGSYAISRRQDIERAIGEQRGVHFVLEPVFNSHIVDRSMSTCEPPPIPGAMRKAMSRTTFRREPMRRTPALLRFDLLRLEDTVRLSLWSGDTSRLPVTDAELLLRAVERLLVAAATGDLDREQIGEALNVDPIWYGPGWLRVVPDLVEVAEVQRLLEEAIAPAQAQVFTEVAGRPLVAHVVATDGLRTPAEAHARCMAALPGRHTAIAPSYYVLHEYRELACATQHIKWGSVVSEGTGRHGS